MIRRNLLRTAAAAGVATTAGCSILSPACKPTDQPLGDLEGLVDAGKNPGIVTIRGVVSRPVSRDMVVGDGTGVAILNPPGLNRFNPEWFSEGECVKATGHAMGDYSREYGVLNLDISTEEDVETVGLGKAKGGSRELPQEPDVGFELEFEDDVVRLTHTGSEAVPAKYLEIRHTTNDWADVTVDRWHELGDVGPEERIGKGDVITESRPGGGRLLWRASEHLAYPVSSGWVL